MLIICQAPMVKSASEGQFEIDPEARRECEDIMDKIRNENPSYWPYGLDIKGHNAGVWMVRQASDNKPVGFVGWQERHEGRVKTGYYSVGILPEYRGHGLASAAVSNLLREKAAGVDRVQAFIVPHNEPSHNLARKLGIPIVHNG